MEKKWLQFAWGCNGESVSVYMAKQGIWSSFNMLMELQKIIFNWIINIMLWAHKMSLRVRSVSLIKNISNWVNIKIFEEKLWWLYFSYLPINWKVRHLVAKLFYTPIHTYKCKKLITKWTTNEDIPVKRASA